MARILVIDDNDDLRSLVHFILNREGHTVHQACTGEEGMTVVQSESLDLVITDILMPGKGGLGVILELHERFPSVKVIAVSGGFKEGGGETLPISKVLGVPRTLTKPFTHEELVAAVNEVLEKQGA